MPFDLFELHKQFIFSSKSNKLIYLTKRQLQRILITCLAFESLYINNESTFYEYVFFKLLYIFIYIYNKYIYNNNIFNVHFLHF